MRFYEGDYAYELERMRDAATQLFTGWRYNVYRIRPDNKIVCSGEAQTQEAAEMAAHKARHSVMKSDREGGRTRAA